MPFFLKIFLFSAIASASFFTVAGILTFQFFGVPTMHILIFGSVGLLILTVVMSYLFSSIVSREVYELINKEKELNHLKDDFFMLASHEMRTPLTAIRGNLELIRDMFSGEIKSEEVRHMIIDSYSGTMRLIEIVNSFLDVVKLEQGRMLLEKEKIYPVSLIDELIHEFESASRTKGIELKIDVPADLPMIYTSRARAKQVIYNLVDNAIKATEKGAVTITALRNGGFVEFRVSDTGRGIPKEKQNYLFQKFGHVGSLLTHDATKGTGLGLYLSKLIVSNLGGEIKLVRSDPDKGSEFMFSLPVAA